MTETARIAALTKEVFMYGDTCDGGVLSFSLQTTSGGATISSDTIPYERADGICFVTKEGVPISAVHSNPMSQEVHFTGTSDSAQCIWEVEPIQNDINGRVAKPRRGFFNDNAYVSLRELFTPEELPGWNGEAIANFKVWKTPQGTETENTLVAEGTLSSSAPNAGSPFTAPTSSTQGGTIGAIGDYSNTTIIRGLNAPDSVRFEFHDPASTDDTDGYLTFGAQAANQTVGFARLQSFAGASWVDFGYGNAATSQQAVMYYRFWVGASTTPQAGANKAYVSQYGWNVGTNPAAPTSGRAFQVTTTGEVDAFWATDSTGKLNTRTEYNVEKASGSLLQCQQTNVISRNTSPNTTIELCNAAFWQQLDIYANGVNSASVDPNGLVLPLNATGIVDAQLKIGSDTYFWANAAGLAYLDHSGADNLYIRVNTAGKAIRLDAPSAIYYRTTAGGGAGHVFQYNNGDVCSINGDEFVMGASKRIRWLGEASAPSGSAGRVYYDTTTNKLRCHDGTTWNDLF